MPSIPTPADRAFEALQDTARHLLASNSDPDEEIAWYVHAPGAAIRVKTIGLLTPFLTFTTPDEIQLIIAPEALILSVRRLTAVSAEPRFPIGFVKQQDTYDASSSA
ncbi:unannotated protein [freshwater metagenome]|uniref:Unannotated protein n=1 Tax=freshwater metagenome TaxID=449393 RepID=A0A6J6P6P2_9ZZZZ